jgi:hypothetical protein
MAKAVRSSLGEGGLNVICVYILRSIRPDHGAICCSRSQSFPLPHGAESVQLLMKQ